MRSSIVRVVREIIKSLQIGLLLFGPMYVYLVTNRVGVFWLYIPFAFFILIIMSHYETLNKDEIRETMNQMFIDYGKEEQAE